MVEGAAPPRIAGVRGGAVWVPRPLRLQEHMATTGDDTTEREGVLGALETVEADAHAAVSAPAGDPGAGDALDAAGPLLKPAAPGVRRRAGATRGGRHRRRPTHPVLRKAAIAMVLLLAFPSLFFCASVVGALRTEGNYSFKAKWADWLRGHRAEYVVKAMEDVYFGRKQPKKGGQPEGLNSVPTIAPTSVAAGPTTTLVPHLVPPQPVDLVVQPALENEGLWQPTGPLVGGMPGMYVSQFRADTEYTSQLTSAVWIDPKLLRVKLHPGAQEPGGTWQTPSVVEGPALAKLAAVFNGGFRFQDAHGGMYLEGRVAVPLVDGAASVVIYDDGRIDIGAWNREVSMSADVEAVLQNLTLMVDGGELAPNISHNDTSSWGATLKGSLAVARSGIGVTADGALVYVAGPALSAKTLAESLQRAGAVRAMTLDINPEWVTFNFYEHIDAADPTKVKGAKLYEQLYRSADRYLSTESRDFFVISTP